MDPAKKVLDLQRRVQQAFLAIKDGCNPLTYISRRKTANATDFKLEHTVEELALEVGEIKKIKIEENQMEIFLTEINLLEQSTARLQAIFRLMTVTKELERSGGDQALLLIDKSETEFNEMREKYPFVKKDVEAEIAHIVYSLFIGIVTEKETPKIPKLDDIAKPLRCEFKPINKCSQQCFELLKKARLAIDRPIATLCSEGSIEQQGMFSTEQYINNIQRSVKPCDWLPTLKMEKCKVSDRAIEVLQCLKELLGLAAKNQADLGIARTVGSIIQLYTIRAPPAQHCGVDAAVYFNDCLYLAIELERAKFETIYKLEAPTDGFNFADLLSQLRLSARNTLIRDLAHVKSEFLTWPSDAFSTYLEHKGSRFGPVLAHLKRFASLWGEVCSKSVHAWLMTTTCAYILNLLIDTLNTLPNFERSTCAKVLIVVNEVVDACSGHIRNSERAMKVKFVELKLGQSLQQKVDNLKQEMTKHGANRSLTELFDFKIVA